MSSGAEERFNGDREHDEELRAGNMPTGHSVTS